MNTNVRVVGPAQAARCACEYAACHPHKACDGVPVVQLESYGMKYSVCAACQERHLSAPSFTTPPTPYVYDHDGDIVEPTSNQLHDILSRVIVTMDNTRTDNPGESFSEAHEELRRELGQLFDFIDGALFASGDIHFPVKPVTHKAKDIVR